jgi:hypothetical protein
MGGQEILMAMALGRRKLLQAANRHVFSTLERRSLLHPAQIPHANRPGNPRQKPVVAANPRKQDDRPTWPEVDRPQIQERPVCG